VNTIASKIGRYAESKGQLTKTLNAYSADGIDYDFREEARRAAFATLLPIRPLEALRESTTDRAAEDAALLFTEADRLVVRMERSLIVTIAVYPRPVPTPWAPALCRGSSG